MNEVVALFSSFKSVLKGPPFCTKHFKVFCASDRIVSAFLDLFKFKLLSSEDEEKDDTTF